MRTMTFNGVTFGDGHPIAFDDESEVTGLDDLPDVRTGNVERGRDDGSILGPATYGDRVITVPLVLLDDPGMPVQVDRLRAATNDRLESQLSWNFGRGDYMVFARCERRRIPSGFTQVRGVGFATLQFVASRPNVFGPVEHSGTTGTASVTGGLGFPHGFPHGFGSATPGTIQVVNEGHVPAPWTATLTGPLSGPRISLVGTVGVLAFDGFDLPAGQTLEIDSRARTILLNGQSSRYGSASLVRWFDLPVGTSRIQLSAASGAGSLTLRWRSTYL